MSNVERQFATLLTIVQNYQIKVVCPKCLRGFSRARTLSDHFQKEEDWVHRGLDQRKTDFKRFLTCYHLAIGAPIPAQELPRGSKCFDWRYVLEHYRAESQQPDELQPLPDEDNELETEEFHPPSEHADSWGPVSGHPPIIAPVHSDKEPRGLQCTGHEVQIKSCSVLELDDQPCHLQVLKNEQVEARIRALIPQMESWLIGTLPIRDAFDNPQEDQGVVFPTTEIDVPLVAVRNLLYEGIGIFTLLRTYKQTATPHNFSRGIYTILRVEGVGKIGHKEVTPAESIWVNCQTTLSAGLILLLTCPPNMTVEEASSK
ncbi:hypothetical protein COH20_010120 [Aspergillus flavus]|nr:uncharacterized protein G4B84_010471 [Aspergillus flavus NRRL3357]QMW37521.1 hypothetical protein G4B11_000757 [Aspergillus flavus]KAF7623893.1 hypothetical protein AFLA_007613 [Aspergillus flavus NRRL3357]QMW34980.1 hypothetical protein G4B84_010471 [Aspergillus flavus NRRL3357]RAQ61817.1 hypothetical protein COH20_010120 [Aspergillus flavus]RAQ63309.1 hypothetical protein COH21_008445 [Aspergillus flavus]